MTATAAVHPSISRTPLPLDADDLATVCVLCSHNCALRVDVRDGRIAAVRGDESSPVTHGYLCNKAMAIPHYVEHAQRVTTPLRRRRGGGFEAISWDVAIAEIAAKLGAIRDAHGPRAYAVVGVGGQANHMDGPWALGFMRGFGSKRWFCAFAQEKTQHSLLDQWMFDASPATFLHPDQRNARTLLALGTNPRISNRGHNANDWFTEFTKRGGALIVADPRETETTRGATTHLRVRPGGDVWLLVGMVATVLRREGLLDARFVQERVAGFEQVRDAFADVDVADMAARAGISLEALVDATVTFATRGPAGILYDLGVEMTPFSTLISWLLRLVLVLTGNLGRAGGNVFFESFVPPVVDRDRLSEPERALASGIPAIRALGNAGMFSPTLVPEEILVDHPERIRAMIVENCNPLLSYSDASRWREAREKLDLLVVIEPSMTETAALADYVLPTPTGYEKWEYAGFPKAFPEVYVQLRPPVVPARGEGLPESEIYVRLAEALQLFGTPPDELFALAPAAVESAEGAMAYLFALQQAASGSEHRMLFWAYRTLGPHLPAPGLAAMWMLAGVNALTRRDGVVRSLGAEWADKDPASLALELMRRILAHPEGVEVARGDAGRNLDDHLGWADGKVRLAPEPMLAELRRALASPPAVDAEYPLVLAAGLRTRWTANTIQRDPAWRKGRGPHCTLSLAPADAERLGVRAGDVVRVSTRRGALEMPATIDAKLQPGHCWMPNGFGAVWTRPDGGTETVGGNQNELTDVTDRDPFTGVPHHRHVACRVERVAAASAA